MLIGDHEDCLECGGINIAVLWLELVILVRKRKLCPRKVGGFQQCISIRYIAVLGI